MNSSDDSEMREITTLYSKFTQIQISSEKQVHSLTDFESSNAALENEIMELQEQLRNECNHDRILDEDYKLLTIRKNNMEETLQLCEQARDVENQETEELEQHLAELKVRLNKRRYSSLRLQLKPFHMMYNIIYLNTIFIFWFTQSSASAESILES